MGLKAELFRKQEALRKERLQQNSTTVKAKPVPKVGWASEELKLHTLFRHPDLPFSDIPIWPIFYQSNYFFFWGWTKTNYWSGIEPVTSRLTCQHPVFQLGIKHYFWRSPCLVIIFIFGVPVSRIARNNTQVKISSPAQVKLSLLNYKLFKKFTQSASLTLSVPTVVCVLNLNWPAFWGTLYECIK